MLTGPLPALVDHSKMATQQAVIEGSVPVSQIARFSAILADSEGEVRLRLEFTRNEHDRTRVTGETTVSVNLMCQNCLQSFSRELQTSLCVTIVPDSEKLQTLDELEDGFISADPMVRLVDLIEDELILSVPMVPRHDFGSCPNEDNSTEPASSEDAGELTHRPFAGLSDQMAATSDRNRNKAES